MERPSGSYSQTFDEASELGDDALQIWWSQRIMGEMRFWEDADKKLAKRLRQALEEMRGSLGILRAELPAQKIREQRRAVPPHRHRSAEPINFDLWRERERYICR